MGRQGRSRAVSGGEMAFVRKAKLRKLDVDRTELQHPVYRVIGAA
jgi:hypothetical protein